MLMFVGCEDQLKGALIVADSMSAPMKRIAAAWRWKPRAPEVRPTRVRMASSWRRR